MLALVLPLIASACSPTWSPDAATKAEPGRPLMLWSDPKTCETLVVTGPHKRASGLRATLVTYAPGGAIATRAELPKTMWPAAAVMDAPRQRVLLAKAVSAGTATEVTIESRRPRDGALERSFGSAGAVNLSAPRLADAKAAAGGEVALAVDAQGRLHVVATVVSVKADTVLYAWRLLPDGRIDPAWRSTGAVVSEHAFTNSGELVAALTPEGRLLVAAGAKAAAQLFRFTENGELDGNFGEAGKAAPKASSSALVVLPLPGGGLRFASRARTQEVTTLDAKGAPVGRPLKWAVHDTRREFPIGLEAVSGGRLLITARSFEHSTQRASLTLTLWRGDGRLDTRFGTDGILEVDDPASNFQGVATTLDADGNVLVVGLHSKAGDAFDGTLFLWRFPLPPATEEPAPRETSFGGGAAGPAGRGAVPTKAPVSDAIAEPTVPTRPPTTGPSTPTQTPQAPAPEAPSLYVYVDEKGVETWVDSLEQVPPKFRAKARKHSP